MKKVLYIDMDNVIVDFKTGIDRIPSLVMEQHVAIHGTNEHGEPKNLDEIPGIFALMEPVENAIAAVTELTSLYDTYVLSTSPWLNPSAWSDKLRWIQMHFGSDESSPLYKRLILSHHKNLNDGHFLVDDRLANGAEVFGQRPGAEHIHFGQQPFDNWDQVVSYLAARA